MHARLFRNLRKSSPHIRCLSTAAQPQSQPPVLLLANIYSRNYARRLFLDDHAKEFKERGYNLFMGEGMGKQKTLQEEVAVAKRNEAMIQRLIEVNPSITKILRNRFQFTHEQVSAACKSYLEKTPGTHDMPRDAFIHFIESFDHNAVSFYKSLIANNFLYQNLDLNYYPDESRPIGSPGDLEFRGEQYALQINDAYCKQRQGVVCILGGSHLLSDPIREMMQGIDETFPRIKLLGERLSKEVRFICLFPYFKNYFPR